MDNPLALGTPEEDMDDLTAHLEHALNTYQPADGQDDYDLGDGSELPPGHGLDRYYNMAEESPAASGYVPSLEHPSLTYGQLVAPSAHESDQRYEPSLHPPPLVPQTYDTSAANAQAGTELHPVNQGYGQAQTQAEASTSAPRISHAGAHSHSSPMTFTVTDPVKRELGGLFGLKAGHVTYLVTTNLRGAVPGFTKGPTFSVRRRFRDFVALAAALKARHRGYFIPPRPERNAVEGQRMTDTFVEERRAALERYLNRLARHPVLAVSQELRVFVEADGELESSPSWAAVAPAPTVGFVEGTAKLSKQLLGLEQSVLDPVQAAQPTKKAADPLRALRETAQAMASNGAAAPELPQGEAELRHERETLEAKRDALTLATRSAERLVHRLDRLSQVHGDAGLAFFKLSKFEEAEGPHLAQFTGTVRQSQSLANGNKLLATSFVRTARLIRRTVGRTAHDLSVLHDQLASMPPAIKGLSTREKQLLTTETLAADVQARERSIKELETSGAKVLGGDQSKARRVEDLRNDVAKLQCSITAAKAEYDRIAEINKQELSRTNKEYESEMLRMVLGFSTSQALGAQRTSEVWLQLANELSAPPEQLARVRSQVLEAQQQPVPIVAAAPKHMKLQYDANPLGEGFSGSS